MKITDQRLRAALVGALLLLTYQLYSAGAEGPFLFDDYANLPALGDYGAINTGERLISYLTSGFAGPTGRPIALLSFLIDDNKWPTSPEGFKYTNTLIHLLNGALLIWLSVKVARALEYSSKHAEWIGLLAGGMWLLHPLWVSTTLYVVQRMTLLSATFVFIGLLAYTHGRQKLEQGAPRRGYSWMCSGLLFGTLMAVLSKENGALLPLFALIIELIVFTRPHTSKISVKQLTGLRIWRAVFLVAPSALILAYLVYKIPGSIESAERIRDFTLTQRLLTEPRIVMDYIGHLLLPEPYTAGLFQDNVVLSTSLVTPWTTLPAIAGIVALLGLGWMARVRYPALALAIFFFFGGHILESSIIPLELYFEHRNYVPAAFVFFTLAAWLVTGGKLSLKFRAVAALIAITVLSGMTWMRADLWGNATQQGLVWARENPQSARARTYAALIWQQKGQYDPARRILNGASARQPNSVMLELNRLSLACTTNQVRQEELSDASQALRTDKRTERLAYNIIGKFIDALDGEPCVGLQAAGIERLLQAALANPAIARSEGSLQSILNLYGLLQLKTENPEAAAERFIEALHIKPTPDAALTEAAQLGSHGYPCLGLAVLDAYDAAATREVQSGFSMSALHSWWLRESGYYSSELDRISRLLHRDASNAGQSCFEESKSGA